MIGTTIPSRRKRRQTSSASKKVMECTPAGYNVAKGVIIDIAYLGSESVYDIRLESPDPEKPGKRIRVIRPNLTRWDQEDFSWDEPVWIGWHAEATHVLLQ